MNISKAIDPNEGFPNIERDVILQLLPRILTWQSFCEDLNLLHRWYLKRMRTEIGHKLGEVSRQCPTLGALLSKTLGDLSDSGTTRLVGAPETYNRTLSPDKDILAHVPFFRSALSAERIRAGLCDSSDPCWSALGDFYSVGGTKSVDPRLDSWSPENSLAAPLVNEIIPIDFWSPYAQNLNSLPRPFEPYSAAEISLLSLHLKEAFDNIEGLTPPAAHIIRLFIKVIIPRKEGSRPNWLGTSSTPSYIGRTIFRNGGDMDLAMLADGLVHESIHALLYTTELFKPFVAASAPTARLVRSPWSDNLLSLRTYVHACFVWYGLANFWNRALEANTFVTQRAREHLAQALRGFRLANPVDLLISYFGLIDSSVLEIVGSLRSGLDKITAMAGA